MILAYGFTNNFLTNVDNVTDNIRSTTYANALHVRMASFMDFLQWTPTTKTRISVNSTLGWMKDYFPEQGIYNKGLYGNFNGNISQKLFWKVRRIFFENKKSHKRHTTAHKQHKYQLFAIC